MRRILSLALCSGVLLTACSDEGSSDAGTQDAGVTCEQPASVAPERPVATTGRIDVIDTDRWIPAEGQRQRLRSAGTSFLSKTAPIWPVNSAGLWTAIPEDTCIVTNLDAPVMLSGPYKSIGTDLALIDDQGTAVVRWNRTPSDDGPVYQYASSVEQSRHLDPSQVELDREWTYSTSGDPNEGNSPTSAKVGAIADFEVTPAITSTGTPTRLSRQGTTIAWTVASQPATMSIVLGRALGSGGNARFLICRPVDDGSFQIPATEIAKLEADANERLDIIVSRSRVVSFCNEAVPNGVVFHSLSFLADALLP